MPKLINLKFNYTFGDMQLNFQQARKFKNDHQYLKGRHFQFKDHECCIDFIFIGPGDRKRLAEFLQSVKKTGYIPAELEAGMHVPYFLPDFKDNSFDAHAIISTKNPIYKDCIVHRELSFVLNQLSIPVDLDFYMNFK